MFTQAICNLHPSLEEYNQLKYTAFIHQVCVNICDVFFGLGGGVPLLHQCAARGFRRGNLKQKICNTKQNKRSQNDSQKVNYQK